MRIAVTGSSGLVGRFLVRGLMAAGHEVDPLNGWRLGQPAELSGCDALVHAAFAHEPGKYRGGEGDDPDRFIRFNLDGSLRLFDDARQQGVGAVVFLSSRAVYDALPEGTPLPDGTPAAPLSLYGRIKADAEAALFDLANPQFATASIRATGVYGAGEGQKWQPLFDDYLAGRPITPRVATELHGGDLALAVLLLLDQRGQGPFNASDLLLDRHDLLAEMQRLTGSPHPLPPCSDAKVSVMTCERLHGLGWRPRGWDGLLASLPGMLR